MAAAAQTQTVLRLIPHRVRCSTSAIMRSEGQKSSPRQHQQLGSHLPAAVAVLMALTTAFLLGVKLGGDSCGGAPKPLKPKQPVTGLDDSRLAGLGLLPEAAADAEARRESGRQHLAVLIPYRNRAANLARMLPVTVECLQRGNADFSIFILEQVSYLLSRAVIIT